MAFKRGQPGQEDEQNSPEKLMAGYGAADATAQPGRPANGAQRTSFSAPSFGTQDTGPTATGYVNFDRFFDANRTAAQNTANKVTGQVQQTATGAKNALGGVQQSFNDAVQGGTLQGPSAAVSSYAQTGQAPSAGAQKGKPAGAVSSQQQQTQQQTQEGQRKQSYEDQITQGAASDGAYNGPTSLDVMSGYGDALKQAHQAQDQLDATRSQGGLQGLLQTSAQPAGYSDQMSQFDAALTGRAGGEEFGNLRNQYSGANSFENLFNNAASSAAQQAAAAKGQGAANAQAWKDTDATNKARKQSEWEQNRPTIKAGAETQDIPTGGNSDQVWTNSGIGVDDGNGNVTWADPNGAPPSNTWGATTNAEYWADRSGAYQTFDQAKDPQNAQATTWAKQFGVNQTDADFVLNAMTAADWTAYQAAAHQGPTAMRKWFEAILARRQS